MKKTILALSFAFLTFISVNAQSPVKDIKFGGRIMYDMAVWGDSTMDNSAQNLEEFDFIIPGNYMGM